MAQRSLDNRMVWLVLGVVAGLCIAYFWPHEPALAVTSDRNDKFAMVTSEVSFAGSVEGVFVLDFLTGKLQGAVLNNKLGKFTHAYYRSLAADFGVDPSVEPKYAIVTGRAQLPSQGRATMATGVVYVGELSSGKVVAYGFPYNESNRPVPPVPLQPLDVFQFREPLQK